MSIVEDKHCSLWCHKGEKVKPPWVCCYYCRLWICNVSHWKCFMCWMQLYASVSEIVTFFEGATYCADSWITWITFLKSSNFYAKKTTLLWMSSGSFGHFYLNFKIILLYFFLTGIKLSTEEKIKLKIKGKQSFSLSSSSATVNITLDSFISMLKIKGSSNNQCQWILETTEDHKEKHPFYKLNKTSSVNKNVLFFPLSRTSMHDTKYKHI